MIHEDEKVELARIIAGGAYNEGFWYKRWQGAKQPSEEETLQKEIWALKSEADTITNKRQIRKLEEKIKKIYGRRRAFVQQGYNMGWNDEQKRIDNLQAAAIYLHRANVGFHFYG